jgi:TPR repeat protein
MRATFAAALLTVALSTAAVAQTDALTPLRTAAEQGDVAAQVELARRFEAGDGVLQNFASAADWYARAAEAGSSEAANRLGRFLHAGLGMPRDVPRAIALLERAAQGGEAEYVHDLALVLESSAEDEATLSRAADLYRAAAEAGNLDAAVSLGVLLQDGRGVTQDFPAAAALYRRAADEGHPRAQNNLGLLHVRGDGVPQDYARAAALFQAAADQGLSEALTNLGVLYENGYGVAQSDELAAQFYRLGGQGTTALSQTVRRVYDPRLAPPASDPDALKALERSARAGDPVAEFQLAWLLLEGEPVEPRRAIRAAQLMRRAAAAGHAPAMANLALLYFNGSGVPQDYVLGQKWLVLAGSSGFDGAAGLSALWTVRMTPEQINEAQARAQARWAASHRQGD